MTSFMENLTQSLTQITSEAMLTYPNGNTEYSKRAIGHPGNSPSIGASGSPSPSNNSSIYEAVDGPAAEEVTCKECGKEFRDRMAWRNHQRNHKEFPCPQCDYVARRRDHLRSHVLTRHENDKTYKCSECDFSTVYHSNYKNHMAMHLEQKRHIDSTQQQDADFGGATDWICSIFEYANDSTATATAPSPSSCPTTSVEKFVIIPSEPAPPMRKRSKRSTIVAPVATSPADGTRINVDQYRASSPKMAKTEEESEFSQLVQALDPISPSQQLQFRQVADKPQVHAPLNSISTPKVDRPAAAAAGLSSFMQHAAENAKLRRQLAEKDVEIAQLQNQKRDAASNTDLLLARIEQLEKQLDTRNQLVTKLTLKLNGMDDD